MAIRGELPRRVSRLQILMLVGSIIWGAAAVIVVEKYDHLIVEHLANFIETGLGVSWKSSVILAFAGVGVVFLVPLLASLKYHFWLEKKYGVVTLKSDE